MKGYLSKLFWIFVGALASGALVVGFLVLAPGPSDRRPSASQAVEATTPDITVIVSEGYLNRKVAQALEETAAAAGAKTALNSTVDIQPGEKILVTLEGTIGTAGFAVTARVEMEERVAVQGDTLEYRLEHLRLAGVPFPRGLLPRAFQEAVNTVEEELVRATRGQFDKARLYPTRVRTTETTLVVEFKAE